MANGLLCFDYPHRGLHEPVSLSQWIAGTVLNTGILSDPIMLFLCKYEADPMLQEV
jgi:hypothetical protein